MHTQNDNLDPRVYVACLASYTKGILHGRWIKLEGADQEDLTNEIKVMLKASPENNAEEFAVHDYDDMPSSLGEYPQLSDLVKAAELVLEHGEAALELMAEESPKDAEIILDDGYFSIGFGCDYDSESDWAYEHTQECGYYLGAFEAYIDWERVAHDWLMDFRSIGNYYFCL